MTVATKPKPRVRVPSPNEARVRSMRIDDPTWERITTAAAERGLSRSELLRLGVDALLGPPDSDTAA